MLTSIYIEVKSNKIRNPTPLSEYDPDMPFTMVLIEENKSGKLGPSRNRSGHCFYAT